MYLVPVLVAVDATDPAHAEALAGEIVAGHALHVDQARRLGPARAALATLHVHVYADGLELPPAPRP